ncbi:MAG: DUF3494 domain-containing protein, partial [Bacteroidetes bacterium]|nr:DUF3494 domain-containing protein [Bacteroidota bacterium]
MKNILLLIVTFVTLFAYPKVNHAQAPDLGRAGSFALFTSVGAFSSSGATIIRGDIGTGVGAYSGTPTLIGSKHVADSVSTKAATDLAVAYAYLYALTCDSTIGTTLGNNQTLSPNVYCLGAASTLNGKLTLDAKGNSNAIFVFKIDGAFSTSSLSSVKLINGASLCNVYWNVNGAVELGDSSVFMGNI